MASYKVPQDVEADDKLLGPFTARQFFYLVGFTIAAGLTYFAGTVFLPLAVLPLLPAIVLLVLALPLKKDQPMELYFLSIISFYLKPRKKLWDPDGIIQLVEIYVPDNTEKEPEIKDLTFEQAQEQFSFLANVIDSEGRSIRGIELNSPFNANFIKETDSTQDIHDDTGLVSQNFNQIIAERDQEKRQQLVDNLQNETPADQYPLADQVNYSNQLPTPPQPQPITSSDFTQPTPVPSQQPRPVPTSQTSNIVQPNEIMFDQPDDALKNQSLQPYQSGIRQTVIQPITTPQTLQDLPQDLQRLATNENLSIEAIASEARKINQRLSVADNQEEVVISLRR